MKAGVTLKSPRGFFAAGPEMLQALEILSDGAFKVFVYCALKASRRTGRCLTDYQQIARALGKSRRSMSAYLQELVKKGVCRVQPACNQHQTGLIEIEDAFWPYEKNEAEPVSAAEKEFVDRIQSFLLNHPVVRCSFGAADRHFAAQLFRREIPWLQLERALLLGLARKYIRGLNHPQDSPITSLAYFQALIREVADTGVSETYWSYLQQRLPVYRRRWLDQNPSRGTR